jgi:hypothetical protein
MNVSIKYAVAANLLTLENQDKRLPANFVLLKIMAKNVGRLAWRNCPTCLLKSIFCKKIKKF